MTSNHDRLLEWQRRMDPENFNKKRGAQYHTAPSVVFPDSSDYPEGVPEESVTILFHLDGANWLGGDKKVVAKNPEFIEKPPKTKTAKHGPVIILTESSVLGACEVKDNFYWSAQVLSQHEVLLATFKPGKFNKEGKRKIVVIATFMPNPGDED